MTFLPETKAVEAILSDEWLTISFNQPEKRNALTEELTTDIRNILETIKNNDLIRGITMRGEGGVFCAGGDLKSFKSGLNEIFVYPSFTDLKFVTLALDLSLILFVNVCLNFLHLARSTTSISKLVE